MNQPEAQRPYPPMPKPIIVAGGFPPFFTAADMRAYVDADRAQAPVADQPAEPSPAALRARIEALEAELEEARQEPWPEWAERMKRTIRKYSGYDGFDDQTEGIDLPEELDELLSTQPGAHVVEAVATVARKDGELCIDWLLEGGIAALAGGETLLVSNSKLTDDEGYGEVYLLPVAPKGDSNG